MKSLLNSQVSQHEEKELAQQIADFICPDGLSTDAAKSTWKTLEPAIPDILSGYYDSAAKIPDLSGKVAGNPARLKKHQNRQLEHWRYIFNNALSVEFEGRSTKIGNIHAENGVKFQWYIAAYGRILHDAFPVLTSKHRLSPTKLSQNIQTLVSRIFLDMALACDAYQNGSIQRHEEETQRENVLSSLTNLADTVRDINDVTMNMAVLSRNTHNASDGAHTISTAAEEMVNSVKEISRYSVSTAEDADAANTAVSKSLTAMQDVSRTIGEIAQSSDESTASLVELHQAVNQISDFLTVIESIANQTNLLALNATIEAARAGAAGKGFAVVASEVKDLAVQAAKATEDVAQRIETLKKGMTAIEHSIANAGSTVTHGQETISVTNELIQSVASQVANVSGKMQEISSILQQQKDASQEISERINSVANLATDNENRLAEMSQCLQKSNDRFVENANTWFDDSSHRSLCEMAKIDHVLFKKRVVDTIMGSGDWLANEVPDHHNCRLGKWYDAVSHPAIREHPAVAALVEPHKEVHASAKRALDAHAADRADEAIRFLGELDDASKKVLSGLAELAHALNSDLRLVDRRHHVRKLTAGQAHLSGENITRDVRVKDKSNSGMRVEGLAPQDVGKIVNILFDDKFLLGEIVWQDGTQGGIHFLKGGLKKRLEN